MANFVIVGSNSTIAKVLIDNLLKNKHRVFTISRHDKSDFLTTHYKADASNFEEMDKAFDIAQKEMVEIDGVVNFCGSLCLKPAHLTSYDTYLQTVHSSLTTSFATVRSSVKNMKNGGSIVLISSAVANIGLPNHEAIAAAKAGVIGLAKSTAATYANKNIRCNVVCPGLIESNLTKSIVENKNSLEFSLKMHGLNRVGVPRDIASVIEFLLNPDNSWLTGSVINVDGGLGNVKVHK
jgi:NAD(P)-dependent dehydrogenase (short-subunit alcohol dehydrogenase family)